MRSLGALRRLLTRWPRECGIAAAVLWSCAYFFQGGGWNQSAHFATTYSLIEDGTFLLDRYRASSGDLARIGEHVVSNKAVGTALAAIPGYLVARVLTAAVDNPGDQIIVRAYLTTVLSAGVALAALAVLLYRLLLRRLAARDAALVALATALATPLFPNSTMLTSNPFAALTALAAYAVLSKPGPPSRSRLFVAGVLAAAPACFEYHLAILAAPFGLYALWLCRPRPLRALAMVGGALVVLLVPSAHHFVVYGHPLSVGYASLTNPTGAREAAIGFMGFDGFSIARLYELTFGTSRGLFFLSPFLVAAVPGFARLWRVSRAEAMVTGGCAALILGAIASLVYWHSGSSVGSRYALSCVVFLAFGVGAIVAHHRRWVGLGIAVAFAFMLLATSVTAIPPTPSPRPPYQNVIGWYHQAFSIGKLANYQSPILLDQVAGDGHPSLPFAFNLGLLAGLPGRWSLLPFLAGLWAICRWLWRTTSEPGGHAHGATLSS